MENVRDYFEFMERVLIIHNIAPPLFQQAMDIWKAVNVVF